MKSQKSRKSAKSPWTPLHQARQAWNDYQTGRTLRKNVAQMELYLRQRCVENSSEPRESRIGGSSRTRLEDRQRRRQFNTSWKYHHGQEFPWRIERPVQEEENWRGSWLLEVKDMKAMSWKKECRRKETKWRLETVPQSHWPLPYDYQTTKKSSRPAGFLPK